MAATAFRTVYIEEFVAGFEENRSLLSTACTTNAIVNGNTAYFLIADSGGATAVTRGANGLIPARSDNLTQTACTITEWHDLVQKTGFSLDFGQADQRRIMQMTSMGVLNRKMDEQIITELGNATNDTGTSATASIDMVVKSQVILGNNEVPVEEEDNMFGLITPAFNGYLMQTPQYASADYVSVKSFEGPMRRYRRWMGINWIVHPNLSGVGTSTELCYMFHRRAIGHATDKARLDSRIGVDEEQNYSWARTSGFMGAKLLQNSGVVQMKHNGSAYVAS